MKCECCGKEFDEKYYTLCPQCHREITKKERFYSAMWQTVYTFSSILVGILVLAGLDRLFRFEVAVILFVPIMFIWILSIVRTKERKTAEIITNIKKILKNPDFDNNPGLLIYEIIKTIKL